MTLWRHGDIRGLDIRFPREQTHVGAGLRGRAPTTASVYSLTVFSNSAPQFVTFQSVASLLGKLRQAWQAYQLIVFAYIRGNNLMSSLKGGIESCFLEP